MEVVNMVNAREYGVPKTEEERVATHESTYGSSELPPRGTGHNPGTVEEQAAKLIVDTLSESMRADREINMAASAGTNDLEFERVQPGRQLHITHLSGYDDTSSPTKIRVGYKHGDDVNWVKCISAPLVSETVALDGELRLRSGMIPTVRFEGATSGDDLYATLNGYWIKYH